MAGGGGGRGERRKEKMSRPLPVLQSPSKAVWYLFAIGTFKLLPFALMGFCFPGSQSFL